jgi:hypothetical protein
MVFKSALNLARYISEMFEICLVQINMKIVERAVRNVQAETHDGFK